MQNFLMKIQMKKNGNKFKKSYNMKLSQDQSFMSTD